MSGFKKVLTVIAHGWTDRQMDGQLEERTNRVKTKIKALLGFLDTF